MNTKILVVSNEALANTSSNGRTLRNFLLNIPKEQLAQFYIHGEPDDGVCSDFYRVSDKDALNAFLFKKRKESTVKNAPTSNGNKKINKNCRTMVIRDIVWKSYRWWTKDFDSFVKRFSPDVIFLQAGDAPFMYDLTMKLSRKYNLPIIMYNSEEFVLKEKLYSGAKKNSIWHKWLKRRLEKSYKKIMQTVKHCIYNTEFLEQQYQKRYPHQGKSSVLYTVSELERMADKTDKAHFNLLYCGNLGVGRVDPLDEIAKVLYCVDNAATLDVYGRFVNEEDEKKLCSNLNVRYGGVVSYETVKSLMSEASMLVHCENKDRLANLRGAFSTKIADSLASGKPFLVYAIKEYPFVQYLDENQSAHIATDPCELEKVLRDCINNAYYRVKYVGNAVCLAAENHRSSKNAQKMCNLIESIEKTCQQKT